MPEPGYFTRLRRVALCVATFALSMQATMSYAQFGGQSAPAALMSDLVERHVSVNGLERRFFAYVPKDHGQRGMLPVVLAFHGGGQRPEGLADIAAIQNA